MGNSRRSLAMSVVLLSLLLLVPVATSVAAEPVTAGASGRSSQDGPPSTQRPVPSHPQTLHSHAHPSQVRVARRHHTLSAVSDGGGRGSLLVDRGRIAQSKSKRSQLSTHQSDTTARASNDCKLAENGDPVAAYRLGFRYLHGVGVVRDRQLGGSWMRAAASRGYPPALHVVAMIPTTVGRVRPWCGHDAAPVRSPTPPPKDIEELVRSIAPHYGLDPALVLAVIEVESTFNTDAVSPKNAAGLMQLIPETAARFGVSNVFDPADNLRGGMKYLQWLLAYFEGNVTLALAGYNAGEHAVDRHGGIPLYPETQAYVRKVTRLYRSTVHPFNRGLTAPSSAALG